MYYIYSNITINVSIEINKSEINKSEIDINKN